MLGNLRGDDAFDLSLGVCVGVLRSTHLCVGSSQRVVPSKDRGLRH